MRGRNPAGPEFVDRLNGSEKAKRRARVVLELIAGQCRVPEACERLDIKEARLDQLRLEGLQALVTELEEKPVGRPAHVPSPAEVENEQLRAGVARLTAELAVALVRAEVGVGLPRVGAELKKNEAAPPATAPSILNAGAAPGPSIPSEESIVAHIKKLMPNEPVAEGPPRRGFPGQRADRENEQVIRGHVVATGQFLVEQGRTWDETAGLLGVPERTLATGDSTSPPTRSPPFHSAVAPISRRPRNEPRSSSASTSWGRASACPPCASSSPASHASNSANILNRYRREWRQRHRQVLNELHWSDARLGLGHRPPRPAHSGHRWPLPLPVRRARPGQRPSAALAPRHRRHRAHHCRGDRGTVHGPRRAAGPEKR